MGTGSSTLRDLLVSGQLLELDYFQFNLLQYYQVLSKLLRTAALRRYLNKFKNMLVSGMIYRKSLSKIYVLLIDSGKLDLGPHQLWERDLQHQINEADWIRTSKYINIAIWKCHLGALPFVGQDERKTPPGSTLGQIEQHLRRGKATCPLFSAL